MNNKWLDGYARSLVQHAARRAPASLAERLEEEWLADFEERKGQLARLRFGAGCCWATKVIAHEYLEPKMAATATAAATAGSATAGATATTSTGPDYSFLSGRTTAVVAILGLHALIIYAFATGLMHKVYDVIIPPISVIPVPPKAVEPPPVILPQPIIRAPRIDVDPTHLPKIDDPATIAPVVVSTTGDDFRTPPTAVAHQIVVNRVPGGPAKGFPNTEDYYPARLIRERTTGSVTVRACTDEKGRLTGDPTLAQTSGTADLDQAALRLAKAGSGRYRPTTEDGRPVSSCFPFRVTYTLRN